MLENFNLANADLNGMEDVLTRQVRGSRRTNTALGIAIVDSAEITLCITQGGAKRWKSCLDFD